MVKNALKIKFLIKSFDIHGLNGKHILMTWITWR